MNLLVRAIRSELTSLLTTKGLANARVEWKPNRRGELVIAVLVPPSSLEALGANGAELIADVTKEMKRIATEKDLAKTRVVTKASAHGELVIGLVVPPRYERQWES